MNVEKDIDRCKLQPASTITQCHVSKTFQGENNSIAIRGALDI